MAIYLNSVEARQPSMEILPAEAPDFFFAGWYHGMNPGGKVTPARRGALRHPHVGAGREPCAPGQRAATRVDALLYDDMPKLGAIFDRQPEAAALVAQRKTRLAHASSSTARVRTSPLPRAALRSRTP